MKAIWTTAFAVFICLATPQLTNAQLVSVSPNQADPGQTLTVTITADSSDYFNEDALWNINGIWLDGPVDIYGTLVGVSPDSASIYVTFTIPIGTALTLYSPSIDYFSGIQADYLFNSFLVGEYTVSGYVFDDVNMDGVKNPSEFGMPGHQVLVLPDSIYLTADASGYYEFAGEDSLVYTLKWVPDYEFMLTTPGSIDVTLNEYLTNKNFGIHPPVDAYMSGHVFADQNNNGIEDAGDLPFANQNISIQSAQGDILTFTDENGNYTFGGSFNVSYTVQVDPQLDWLVSTSPSAYTFTLLADVNNLDFGLTGPPPTIGLETFVMHTWAACLTPKLFKIKITNTGSAFIDTGYVKFWWPNVTPLDSAYPVPDVIDNDTLYWYYSDLAVGQSMMFYAWLYIPGPGIVMDAYAYAYGTNAASQHGFSQGFDHDIVTCSYDPNEKEANVDTISTLNMPIDYTIRFQNTGTDSAHNVVVRDTLSNLLDWNTFDFISSTHDVNVQLNLNNGAVAFIYNDIMLPDSNVNEPASHGQTSYRILPTANVPAGSVIHNTASIYFDFNPPVVTNDALVAYCNKDTVEPQDLQVCSGDSVMINGEWQSQQGTYTFHTSTVDVCDVLNVAVLTVLPLPLNTVVQIGNQLTAPDSMIAYQWIDCASGLPITGEVSQDFVPAQNGSFAVQVTDANNCSSTSECVTYTSLHNIATPVISLSPNPAFDKLSVSCIGVNGSATIVLNDISGRTLLKTSMNGDGIATLDLNTVAAGVYNVGVMINDRAVANEKIVVIK